MAHRVVPVMLHQGVLHLAMSDPTDRAGLEEISFITGYSVAPVVASDSLIESAMARYYGIPPDEPTSRPALAVRIPVGPTPGNQSVSPPTVVESNAFAQAPVIPSFQPVPPPAPFSSRLRRPSPCRSVR